MKSCKVWYFLGLRLLKDFSEENSKLATLNLVHKKDFRVKKNKFCSFVLQCLNCIREGVFFLKLINLKFSKPGFFTGSLGFS